MWPGFFFVWENDLNRFIWWKKDSHQKNIGIMKNMKIHGLQKMTLLDYPGKVACTVFLGGCDMRCPFCHNAELLSVDAPAEMDDVALLAFLDKRKGLLDGVAITGGEPLLRPDIIPLLQAIREKGFLIKLDTNGNHPDRLMEIVNAGLVDYVAMDIKNSPSKYGQTIGIPNFDLAKVRRSVAFLLEGKVEYEFRTTVVKQFHDDESFREIGEWIRGANKYFLQGYVDRDTVPDKNLSSCDTEQMNHFLEIVTPYVKDAVLRGV